MARENLTDEQVSAEIDRLTNSEAVKLARKEQRLIYRKRQYLYTLRHLEKRGLQLMEKGITYEMLDVADEALDLEES